MRNQYFDFHFEDSESLVSLKYQIYKNKSIANTFFSHIREFLTITPDLECRYTAANGLRYSQKDLQFLFKKLYFNIILLNKKAHVFDLKKMPDKRLKYQIKDKIYKTLNRLHEDFEENMNNLQARYPQVSHIIEYRQQYLQISAILNTINNAIHEIEGTLTNHLNLIKNKKYNGFYSACLLDNNGWTGPRVKLTRQDYAEFSLEQFFGQLSMGYDTTGKSLLHAYWSNDLKIIKEQKITPQTSFSSNVLLCFRSNYLASESVYHDFCQWYDQNQIANYGYSKKIAEQSLGNITIGKLKYLNEREIDLDSLTLEDKLAIVDQIKNKTLKTFIPIIF